MLSLRAHGAIAAGIFAAIIVLAMIGNALEAGGVVAESAAARLIAMIIALMLTVALAFSLIPVMVMLVLGFQARMGGAGNPVIAWAIAHERAIILAFWALLALGLMIAVPAAILDGAFD